MGLSIPSMPSMKKGFRQKRRPAGMSFFLGGLVFSLDAECCDANNPYMNSMDCPGGDQSKTSHRDQILLFCAYGLHINGCHLNN
jgi:hypothetical protein